MNKKPLHEKTVEKIMGEIYSREVNIYIHTFWDRGYCFSCDGNVREGFKHEFETYDFREGIEWLWRNAKP